MNKSTKNVFIYTLMSFIQKGISFFIIPLYTIILEPEELGIANQTIALGAGYILFSTFALDEAAARFFFRNRKDEAQVKETVGTILLISFFLSFILGVLLYLGRSVFYESFIGHISDKFVLTSIFIVFTSPLFLIYQKILRIQEKAKEFSILLFSISMIQIFFSVVFVVALNYGGFGILLAYMITSTISFVYCLYKLAPSISYKIQIVRVKEVLEYSLPILPHRLAGWGLTGFSILAIGYFLDSEAVGIYGAVAFLAVIVDVLSKAFFNAYQPWVYKKLEQGRDGIQSIVKLSKAVGLGICLGGFGLSLFSKELLIFFIDAKYEYGFVYAPVIIFSSIILSLGSLFTFVLYYYKGTTKYVSYASMIGAFINFLCTIIFIPLFGLLGALLSLALANVMVSLSKQFFSGKILQEKVMFFDLFLFSTIGAFISYYSILHNFSFLHRLLFFVPVVIASYYCYRSSFNLIFQTILPKSNVKENRVF